MDRRLTSGSAKARGLAFAVLAGATLLGVQGCFSSGEDSESSSSAVGSSAGRYVPPDEVKEVGAKVRLTYENAPKWTGTSACSKALTKGAKKLGVFLQDKYGQISSVGGYACRKNTADSSRMSVHGTGRALDIMLPTKGGTADNASGDPIANWLIVNAQKIGVQLIIWDHSIWRANGTNDGVYGGPVPHIDHLHVELTTLASTEGTPWFDDPESAVEVGDDTEEVDTEDAGVDTSDGTEEDPWGTDEDAGIDPGSADPSDPWGSEDPSDPGVPTDPSDPGDVPDETDPSAPSQNDGGATSTPPKTDTLPTEDDEESEDDVSYETTDDEAPTESNSLGTSAKKRKSSATLDDIPVNKGCSVPSSHTGGASSPGFVLAVAVAAAMVARRKKS